jgi:hypothetical protein
VTVTRPSASGCKAAAFVAGWQVEQLRRSVVDTWSEMLT